MGRVAAVVTAVVTAVAERNSAPSHVASLHQPIAPFYSFGDTFVKYTLTTPEAEPAVEPWLHSPILRYGLVQSVST